MTVNTNAKGYKKIKVIKWKLYSTNDAVAVFGGCKTLLTRHNCCGP